MTIGATTTILARPAELIATGFDSSMSR